MPRVILRWGTFPSRKECSKDATETDLVELHGSINLEDWISCLYLKYI